MNSRCLHKLKEKQGTSSLETVVLLVIMVFLVYLSFGFFGVVHTAVLHNIHARTYAFETFRHRTNLMYFRSNRGDQSTVQHYYQKQSRLHGIQHERAGSQQTATERPITLGRSFEIQNREEDIHNETLYSNLSTGSRNTSLGMSPVWIRVMYGICFNSECREGI